jgi:hypothetical protein
MSTQLTRRALAMAGGACILGGRSAAAQLPNWAARPVRLVIGFPPGSSSDVMERLVADRLALRLGQPVVSENRPGAGAMIAAENVTRAPPTGTAFCAKLGSQACRRESWPPKRKPGGSAFDEARQLKLARRPRQCAMIAVGSSSCFVTPGFRRVYASTPLPPIRAIQPVKAPAGASRSASGAWSGGRPTPTSRAAAAARRPRRAAQHRR